MTHDDQLRRLAQALADDAAVDWERELAAAASAEQRELVQALAELSVLARPQTNRGKAPDDLADTHDSLQTWGPFVLCEELGRGSSGTVFRAHDPRLERDVALKLIGSGESDADFVRQGRMLARVRHPNVVSVFGAESHGDRDGIWMELIDGRTYQHIVASSGPLSAREAAMVGADICGALAAVHAAGLVHRDVTAKNVMRERGGRTVLLDFSAGRDRRAEYASDLAGTPMYVAPEVLLGQTPGTNAADVYSVGVLLFFLTSGSYPLAAATLRELREAHANPRRRSLTELRPDLPPPFVALVERALSVDPESRPSCAEVARALVDERAASVDVTGGVQKIDGGQLGTRVVAKPVPAWLAVTLSLVTAVVTLLVANWAKGTGASNATTAGLNAEQWRVLDGYLELADESGSVGEWMQAAGLYERADDLLKSSIGVDDPFRGAILAMRGWAFTSAHRPAAAHEWFDLALYKLAQEAAPEHPIRAVIELARARAYDGEQKPSEAVAAVTRSIALHNDMLAAIGIATAPMQTPAPPTLDALCEDTDRDWLLDVFERQAGLNPANVDSDNDGISDDEEDSNGDGVVNGIAWPATCDPRRALGHYGGTDPVRLGFRTERAFSGRVATGTPWPSKAWRIESDPMGFYYQKLTTRQKQAALTRGWRLRTRMSLWQGNGFVNLDLFPNSARFDLNLFVRPGDVASSLLMTSSMPRRGEWLDHGGRGALPLLEFAYDPSSGTTRFLVDGRTARTGYAGYRQYQEDFGLFFGTTDDVGAAERGAGDFALGWLMIR